MRSPVELTRIEAEADVFKRWQVVSDDPAHVMLRDVFRYAAWVHRADLRRAPDGFTQAYIVHPLRNTLLLVEVGVADVDVLAASVLHDTVEDHPGLMVGEVQYAWSDVAGLQVRALARLGELFNPRVAALVAAVTNPPRAVGESWRAHQGRYREHVGALLAAGGDAALIKVADFLDNAGGLDEAALAFERGRKLGQRYAPLVPVFLDWLDGDGSDRISVTGRKILRDRLDAVDRRLKIL